MNKSKHLKRLSLDLLQNLKEEQKSVDLSRYTHGLNLEEKEELASSLFEEAKQLILSGSDFAFHAFDWVRRIAPDSFVIEFKQGVFLFDYGIHKSSDHYLEQAQKHLQKALEINPKSVDTYSLLGDLLVHVGLKAKSVGLFLKADEKYSKASELSKDNPKDLQKFLWDWALCRTYLAKHSGEAIDIKKAIELFQKMAAFEPQQENFWRDFGNSYVSMGLLISDERFLMKALKCFQKALAIKPSYSAGWLSTAHTFHKLYLLTSKESFLSQAHSAYSKAADLKREQYDLWFNWGQLFLHSGILTHEDKHLQMAIVKFEKAHELEPQKPYPLSGLSEAYATLGYLQSDLKQLKLSEDKIKQALAHSKEEASLLYSKGYSYLMQGHYFDDSSYYLMAVEKFKQALNLEPRHFYSLYSLGIAELSMGKQHQDEEHYLKAHEYFKKAASSQSEYPDLWNQWGMAHLRLCELHDDPENIRQAVDKFEKALGFYQDQKPPALLLFNYGCALDLLGHYSDEVQNYERAAEILERLLDKYTGYECVHYNVALVYQHIGEMKLSVDDYSRALHHFHQASIEDPEDGLIWLSWAKSMMDYARMIYDEIKEDVYETLLLDAEKKIRRAMAFGEQEAYFQLACLYSLKKSPVEALHFLKMAKSKDLLPDIEDLLYEPHLEGLRSYEPFEAFIESHPLKEKHDDFSL